MFYRTYECPDCRGVFDHLHHKLSSTEDTPPPNYCPLCGANVGPSRTKRKPKKPKPAIIKSGGAYAKLVVKSENQVYRQMEGASEYRMEQAAQLLGVHKSELSDMKMTNMRDNVKAGESSHIPSPATKIQGQIVDIQRPDGTGTKSTFGLGGSQYALSGQQAAPEFRNTMRSVSLGHQSRVQSTVAAGKKG